MKQPKWVLTPKRKKSILSAIRIHSQMVALGKIEYYKKHKKLQKSK